MKLLKRLLFATLGLTAVLAGILVISIFVIDPNKYRPLIEETVQEQTGIELKLGHIQWRVFPSIGLTLSNISLTDPKVQIQTSRTLLSAEQAEVSLALLPLLRGSIEVGAVGLRQPNIHFTTFKDGTTNWDTLIENDQAPASNEQQTPSDQNELPQLSINRILLEDAQILIEDMLAQTSTTIDAFTLELKDVALDQAVKVDFKTQIRQDDTLHVNLSGKGAIIAQKSLKAASIPEFKLTANIEKAPGLAKPQVATLTLVADLDLEADQAKISTLTVQMAELILSAQATVLSLTNNPSLKADVSLNPLPIKAWLSKTLGIALPETNNPQAFKQVLLSTTVSGSQLSTAPVLELKPFDLTFDKSAIKGSLSYEVNTQKMTADLNLDAIVIDDYLPPASTVDATTERPPANSSDSPLIPVELIRPLNALVSLRAKEVKYQKSTMQNIHFELKASDGLVDIKALNASVFGGSLTTSGSLDVRGPEPKLNLKHQAKALQVQSVLSQFLNTDLAQGLASFDLVLDAKGARVSDIIKALSANSSLSMSEGLLKGINLSQMAQTQLTQWSPLISALVPEDYVSKVPTTFQKDTPIKELIAKLKVQNGKLMAQTLTADLNDSQITGQGQVDLDTLEGTIELNLKLSEKLTNPNFAQLIWPITCQGGISGEMSCKLNASPVRKQIEKLAQNAAESKAKQAINQKLQEKIGTTLNEESAKQEVKEKLEAEKERANQKVEEKLKNKLRGLF